MMITLAVVLFLYLLCSSSYAIGMTINEKIQLQNAADAAAYSAAVVEADGLSRIATINRAMSWTYIQTVKRRMDYIVLEWLNLTKTNFELDKQACYNFNRTPYKQRQPRFFMLEFQPTSCSQHISTSLNDYGPGKWWVGWTENDDNIRLGYVTKEDAGSDAPTGTQFGRFLPYQALVDMPQIKSYTQVRATLIQQINNDNNVLNSLEALMTQNIYTLNAQMETAALDALKRNLPQNNYDHYYYRIGLPNFASPYPPEEDGTNFLSSVLAPFRNTEEDELEFLASSIKTSSLHGIWGDGIDQWFIRGSEKVLIRDVNDGGKHLSVNEKDYISRGIQRGYKSANRLEPALAGAVEALRGNHVAWGDPSDGNWNRTQFNIVTPTKIIADGFVMFISKAQSDMSASMKIAKKAKDNDLKPSCLNSNNLFIEQCLDTKNNFGLVSEYHWCSLKWWCGYRQRWRPSFWGGLRRVGPREQRCYKVSSIRACHNEHMTREVGNKTRAEYKQCYIGKDMMSAKAVTIHGSSNAAPGYITMGYSRIYGDDSRIYNKDYYITPRVKPVKLNHTFFQERINVAVGKKQKNPFYWLFSSNNEQRAVAPNDSIFALFNPTLFSGKNTQSMLVATSSATAAFRSRRYAGHYETNYDQITSFEYDNQYDSDIPTISLDINVQTPGISKSTIEKLRLGCPHKNTANKISERLSNAWNLCETDWQAVFVPHRYADENWIGHQRKDGIFVPYDSVRNNSDVWYRSYPQELNINSNFLIGLGFPNEKGEYLKPLYDTSKGNGRFNVRHPALRNEPSKDFPSEELGLFLLKFKLQ